MRALHVACERPGLVCGFVQHPRFASYPIGHFTEAQLLDMVREPALHVVLGAVVTPDMVPMLAADAAEAVPHDEPPPPAAPAVAQNPARRRAGTRVA